MSHVITSAEYGHFPWHLPPVILVMVFLYVFIAIILLLSWPLLSTVTLRLDTRLPQLTIDWKTVCTLQATYEQDTIMLKIRTPFFHRSWAPANTRDHKRRRPQPTGKHHTRPAVIRIIRVLKKCRLDALDLAADTGNPLLNAWLYPLNYIPLPARRTIRINFENDCYLRLQISAKPWRLLAQLSPPLPTLPSIPRLPHRPEHAAIPTP